MRFERQQMGLFVTGEARRHWPLFVRLTTDDIQKSGSALRDRIRGGKADKKPPSAFNPRSVAAGAKVEREHTTDPGIQREIARDHLAESKDYYKELAKMEAKLEHGKKSDQTKKAIPGQQAPSMQPRPSTSFEQKPDMHLEAAMHYIQGDYHSRQPGGQAQAQHHHQQFGELQKQGARPTAQHFKAALRYLPTKYAQAMKAHNPPLMIKAV